MCTDALRTPMQCFNAKHFCGTSYISASIVVSTSLDAPTPCHDGMRLCECLWGKNKTPHTSTLLSYAPHAA